MSLHTRFQDFIFSILKLRFVNRFVRVLVKPVAAILPNDFVTRIPVVGDIRIALPDSGTLILASDGRDQIASRIYWSGLFSYEPGTLEVYLHLLNHGTVLFDIGANTGLFSLLAASAGKGLEVHAFEPVPGIFSYLLRNIQRNNLRNVKAVCKVVSDHDGTVPFFEPETVMIPSSASMIRRFIVAESRETSLPSITIDTYVREQGISRVDLIKIDAEGSEGLVLEGARNTLRRDRPTIVCEVFRGFSEETLHSLFAGSSYRFFRITDRGLLPQERILGGVTEQEWNYLFITEDNVSRLLEGLPVIR